MDVSRMIQKRYNRVLTLTLLVLQFRTFLGLVETR